MHLQSGTSVASSNGNVDVSVVNTGDRVTFSSGQAGVKLPTNLNIVLGGVAITGAKGDGAHVSCSVPIVIGEQHTVPAGTLTLVDFVNTLGSSAASCAAACPSPPAVAGQGRANRGQQAFQAPRMALVFLCGMSGAVAVAVGVGFRRRLGATRPVSGSVDETGVAEATEKSPLLACETGALQPAPSAARSTL